MNPPETLAQAKRRLAILKSARLKYKLISDRATAAKEAISEERYYLVSALSRHVDAHIMPAQRSDQHYKAIKRKDLAWDTAVCLHLHSGIVTWTVGPEIIDQYFSHLPHISECHYDGAKRTEKMIRLMTP